MRIPNSDLDAIVTAYLPAVEAEMRATIHIPEGPLRPFYGMMAYHLGWLDAEFQSVEARRGKGIRPVLCLLACQAAGGDWERAVPAAAAIELTHNFSLIHDDIEDGDVERRGRPTVWRLWGVPQAINAGDGLFVIARRAFHRLADRGVEPETVQQVIAWYDEACLALCEGQYLDLCFEERMGVTLEEYMQMIRGKTASLLVAALRIGSRLATADTRLVETYAHFGEHLGIAFQLVDDILGLWGDEVVTGKPAGNDLRRRKKTLPVVYALEQEANAAEQPLRALFRQQELSDGDVAFALDLLEACGARRYVEDLAQYHWQRALDALAETGIDNLAQQHLRTLARFLIERQF